MLKEVPVPEDFNPEAEPNEEEIKEYWLQRQNEEDKKPYPAVLNEIPKKYSDVSFENFNPYNEELKNNLEKCKRFVTSDTRFLILLGSNGNGKNHLGFSVLKSLPKLYLHSILPQNIIYGQGKIKLYRSQRAWYLRAVDFFHECNDKISDGAKKAFIREFAVNDMIFFNDLRLDEVSTVSMRSNLFSLIDNIYEWNRRMIISMNFPYDELVKIDPSIDDRIQESCEILTFESESYRRKATFNY